MSQGQLPPPEHPVRAVLHQMVGPAEKSTQGNTWSMSDDDVAVAMADVATIEAFLAATKLARIAEADARSFGVAGATDTAGWIVATRRVRPQTAQRLVRLAQAVRSDRPATGAALAAASVNFEQAEVITGVMADLPKVHAEVQVAAEEFLIGHAAVLNPVELRRLGRKLCETLTVDPDPEEKARRQHESRYLHLVRDFGGMTILRGLLDPEAAAILTAALDPLSAPEAASEGVPDPRTAAQRRADGLTKLAQIGLASGDLPETGGTRPTVVVTVPMQVLNGRLAGAGLLPGDEPISAAVARRIACDANIVPVVCGGQSQPLDIGRASRTVPDPMRRALVARDTACAFPACDRLPNWCEAHHIIPWSRGGSTALDNLALLCTPTIKPSTATAGRPPSTATDSRSSRPRPGSTPTAHPANTTATNYATSAPTRKPLGRPRHRRRSG